MAEDGGKALFIVGARNRYQRRLVQWARRTSPLIRISQPGSIDEAFEALRVVEHPEETSVIVYVRWSPAWSIAHHPPYAAVEEWLEPFDRKLLIWETPYSESPSDYFKVPRETRHTFLLPRCRPRRPVFYYRGPISAYVYLLMGVFLSDQNSDRLERLGSSPQDWRNWVLEVSPFNSRPNLHAFSYLFFKALDGFKRFAGIPATTAGV